MGNPEDKSTAHTSDSGSFLRTVALQQKKIIEKLSEESCSIFFFQFSPYDSTHPQPCKLKQLLRGRTSERYFIIFFNTLAYNQLSSPKMTNATQLCHDQEAKRKINTV